MTAIKLTPLLLFFIILFVLLISVIFKNKFSLAESFKESAVSGQNEYIGGFNTSSFYKSPDGTISVGGSLYTQ